MPSMVLCAWLRLSSTGYPHALSIDYCLAIYTAIASQIAPTINVTIVTGRPTRK
jgi:hypothetical protein